jgi:hypothetical protein
LLPWYGSGAEVSKSLKVPRRYRAPAYGARDASAISSTGAVRSVAENSKPYVPVSGTDSCMLLPAPVARTSAVG